MTRYSLNVFEFSEFNLHTQFVLGRGLELGLGYRVRVIDRLRVTV